MKVYMYYVCMIMRFPLTLSWAWILAPFSASSATTSERPLEAASIRGVQPPCQKHEKEHHIIHVPHTKVNLYIHTYIHTYK